MKYLTVALGKGRLLNEAVKLFEAAGIACPTDKNSRKLIYVNEEYKLKFFLSKDGDVPTYVEYGAADLGIVGKDTLLEERRGLYELLDLGFGRCAMAAAGFEDRLSLMQNGNNFRVATKYPAITEYYFHNERRQSAEIIKLSGSVELAVISGLADMIVDLVQTGTTLKENGLVVFSVIADISARLIANRASLKMEHERITRIMAELKRVIDNPEVSV